MHTALQTVLPVILIGPTPPALRASHPMAKVVVGETAQSRMSRPGTGKTFADVSVLTAIGICNAEDSAEVAILSAALRRDLQTRFSSRNRAPSALLLAEDDVSGEVVGCCGIDVQRLSPEALDYQRLGPYDESLADRPMLSSLAVCPRYRKRGIAKRLCRAAEAEARRWGYNEVLLKVERDNRRARNLYRVLGYRVVAVDKKAERPVASGSGGMRFISTTQVAMRKDLQFPPADVVLSAVVLAGAASFVAISEPEALADAAELALGKWDALLNSLGRR